MFAYCKVCNVHVNVSFGGMYDVVRHSKSASHGTLKNATKTQQQMKSFFYAFVPDKDLCQAAKSSAQPNVIIVNQSQVVTGQRPWSSGLCDCFTDCSSCCLGFWCLPCLSCKVSVRLGEHCCVPYCVVGGLLAMRTKLRANNNIQGTICNDSSIICCCTPCAVCQMDRELNYVGI